MSSGPGLSVSHLCVAVDGVQILRDCSFDVEPGTLCAVRGVNGSGKTTLLKALAGLLPHGGAVRPLPVVRRAARVVFAAQGSGFHERRTVRRHLRLLVGSGLVSGPDVRGVLERLDLTGLLHEVPARMSSGQRQAVALLAPLAARADLLLVDEPFVGLDRARQEAVSSVLTEKLRAGTTVLATSHGVDWVEHRLSQTVVMDGGRVVHDVRPERGPAAGRRHVEIATPRPEVLVAVLVERGYLASVTETPAGAVVLVEVDRVDPVIALADAAGVALLSIGLTRRPA